MASLPPCVGIGLRSPHYKEILRDRPPIPFLECHSENFFVGGGMSLRMLDRIAETYPLSFHGVGLSLGSASGLRTEHLGRLKALCARYSPALVSEHISWSNGARHTVNDLLPLPYTEEALAVLTDNVKRMQDALGRDVLVENPSSYLLLPSSMRESEFVARLIEAAGCKLLLDINNVYVSCRNHGWDAERYLNDLPLNAVEEMHLAGHTEQEVMGRRFLIDHHGAKIAKPVWELYAAALKRFGPCPTLIERDTDIPPLSALLEEASYAESFLIS
jgi:uncharacterized protein (UPF0276 family)